MARYLESATRFGCDLRSNDPWQSRLELGLGQLGYEYLRQRDQGKAGSKVITPAMTAEAVLAIWRRKPHVARFHSGQLFGSLYDEVFTDDITPAPVVVAVRILRVMQQRRRESNSEPGPRFIPYASHFLAMLVGDGLLERLSIRVADLTHLNLNRVLDQLESDLPELYDRAVLTVRLLFGLLLQVDEEKASLQRLSAVFRRGDLLEPLARLRGEAEQLITDFRASETCLSRSHAVYKRLAELRRTLEQPLEPCSYGDKAIEDAVAKLLDIVEQLNGLFGEYPENRASQRYRQRIRDISSELESVDGDKVHQTSERESGENLVGILRGMCQELEYMFGTFDGHAHGASRHLRPLFEMALQLFPDIESAGGSPSSDKARLDAHQK